MATETASQDVTAAERKIAFRYNREGLNSMHYMAMTLAALTGGVHLYLFVANGALPFLLAGLGFFLGVAAMFLVERRTRIYLYMLGIPFALAQVALWVLAGGPDFMLGLVDKVMQLALVYALVVLVGVDRRGEAKRRRKLERKAERAARKVAERE